MAVELKTRILRRPSIPSGNWFLCVEPGTPLNTGATTSGVIRMIPFLIHRPTTISALGIRITTLSAGGNCMLGIYGHNNTTGRPTGAVLASVTGLSTAAAAIVTANLAGNVVLAPGLYWAAAQCDNSTAVIQGANTNATITGALIGSATVGNVSAANAVGALHLQVTNTYGAFPDMTGATFTETLTASAPALLAKVA